MIMKKQFIQLVAMMLVAAVMTSCNQENEEQGGVSTLSVTPSMTEILFAADGASATSGGATVEPVFTVETDCRNWSVASNKAWVSVLRVSRLSDYFSLSVRPATGLIAPETAEVTVTAGDATPIVITVRQQAVPLIPVTGIAVYPEALMNVEIGATATLRAAVLPENTNETNNAIIWESSDPEIATVTDGVVKGISRGAATITAMLERNPSIKKEIPVRVKEFVVITAEVLKNPERPFTPMGDPVNSPGITNRFYGALHWLTNETGAQNGNVDTGSRGSTLCVWATSSSLYPTALNAKLYQAVELEAGDYKFDAYVYYGSYPSSNGNLSYIVAALGDKLIDINNITQTLAYEAIPGASDNSNVLVSINFTVPEKSVVSLGFVADFYNAILHFRKVELWGKR